MNAICYHRSVDKQCVQFFIDASISMEEYMEYRGKWEDVTETVFFKTMDADGSGTIDWSEFLKHEACRTLCRRDRVSTW